MYQSKFAIAHTKGNDEAVLGLFANRERAYSYGKRKSQEWNHDGVLTLIQADFDENGRIKNRVCRVFEIWE